MKDKFTNVVDGFFVFLLTICPLQCLASSFDININLWLVIIFTAMFTVIFAVLAVLEKSKLKYAIWLGVILAIFAFVVFLGRERLITQLNYAVNRVLGIYSEFLPVAQSVSFIKWTATRATELFIALSVPLNGLLTFFIMRLKRILPASIIAIIFVVPCFVLVNTLPALLPLLTMFVVLFTLFVGGAIHRTNATQSGAVTSVIAVLMAVLVAGVYLLNPVKGYERSNWQDNLLDFATSLTGIISYDGEDEVLSTAVRNIRQEIDLSFAGPKEKTHQLVMTIKGSCSGKLYLKGVAYANYEDNKWSILTDEQSKSHPVDYSSAVMTKSTSARKAIINISTKNDERVIYTPYYLSYVPDYGTELCDVLIRNDTDLKDYDVPFQFFEVDKYSAMGRFSSSTSESYYTFNYEDSEQYEDYKSFVYQNYLYVPEEVKAEMLRHAQENGFAESPKMMAVDSVKSYVRDSAEYSLKTERVPEGADISTWLLNESDTGYCVHFATTTAVMLRSLGIPARYVTGYCVEANPDDMTFVTSDNAHAWVEYFDDSMGWVPIDSTPPDFTSIIDEIEPAYPENNQQQTATQPPTQSTTDIQQSEPTEPVTDTQQTDITQATDSTAQSAKVIEYEPPIVKIIKPVIAVLALILLAIIALVLRRVILLKLRKRGFTTSNRNSRAKHIYRYIMKTSEHCRIPIPEEISLIAEKARFSNGRITPSELDTMLTVAQNREKALLKDTDLIKKLYFKYILVLV